MANRYCLNCGSFVPEGVKFCPTCGEPYKEKSSTMPNIVFPQDPQDQVTTPNIAFPKEPEENVDLHTTTDIPFPRKTLTQMRMDDAETQSIPTIEIPQEENVQPAPVVEEQPQPTYVPRKVQKAPKKKKSLLSRIIFDEDEEDEDEETYVQPKQTRQVDYDDEEDEGTHHIGTIILVVILAVLLGAFGFLYFERPDLLNSALQKIGLGLPGYKPAQTVEPTTDPKASVDPSASPVVSAEPTATPTATPTANPYIGKLTVTLAEINIRDTYSTSGNLLGTVSVGSSYDVIASQENEGYTWYEIKDGEWIADSNGSWVDYKAN